MKSPLKNKNLFVCVMLFAVSAFCSGGPIAFSKVKVEPVFVNPPSAQYRNAPSFATKVTTANRWLMIKVEYTPPLEKQPLPVLVGRKKDDRNLKVNTYIDDVELKVNVLLSTGLTDGRNMLYANYNGTAKFWTIRLDGNKHLALMYLPAVLIDRYCGKQRVAGAGKAVLKDFHIEAEFFHNGSMIGRGYYNVDGSEQQARKKFRMMLNSVPKKMVLNNAVLSHRNSPWALLNPDSLDLEKPASQDR